MDISRTLFWTVIAPNLVMANQNVRVTSRIDTKPSDGKPPAQQLRETIGAMDRQVSGAWGMPRQCPACGCVRQP